MLNNQKQGSSPANDAAFDSTPMSSAPGGNRTPAVQRYSATGAGPASITPSTGGAEEMAASSSAGTDYGCHCGDCNGG